MTDDYQKLLNLTYRYLQLRPRSRAEVTRYLAKKTSDSRLVDQLISHLVDLQLVDDTAFSRWYITSRSRNRPMSRRLLAQELKRLGVSLDLTDPSLEPEIVLARQALQKKSRLASREQATRFLASRGFSWSVIEPLVRKEYN